tara:strand:- start:1643 stop:1900 length:258 start_codon:yes stop_codon:yes gene_type:complete
MGKFFEVFDSRAYSIRPDMPEETPDEGTWARTPEPMVYYRASGNFTVKRSFKRDGKWVQTHQTVKTFKQALRLRNHWKNCNDKEG